MSTRPAGRTAAGDMRLLSAWFASRGWKPFHFHQSPRVRPTP